MDEAKFPDGVSDFAGEDEDIKDSSIFGSIFSYPCVNVYSINDSI